MSADNDDVFSTAEMLKAALAACEELEYNKAIPLLLQLADMSVPVACMNLGYIYKYGSEEENIPANEKQSTFWYSKYFFLLNMLSNNGDWEASYKLASCYQYGDNIACDEKKAVELYAAAAEAGHSKSQYHLATLWKYGWCGLNADRERHLFWLEKATTANYPEALYTKGLFYIGESNSSPSEEGMILIKRSAELGFWPAAEYLKRLNH